MWITSRKSFPNLGSKTSALLIRPETIKTPDVFENCTLLRIEHDQRYRLRSFVSSTLIKCYLHPMVIAGIEIELIRKRVKNVNLRIHTPDGRVTVSAPRRTSEAFIAEFVAAKAPWIRKQQARIAAMPPRPELTYTHGEEHAFLGHPYPLEIYAAAGRPGAEFQSGFQSSLQSDTRQNHPKNRASWCTRAIRATPQKSSATSTGRTAGNCRRASTSSCRSGSNASASKTTNRSASAP